MSLQQELAALKAIEAEIADLQHRKQECVADYDRHKKDLKAQLAKLNKQVGGFRQQEGRLAKAIQELENKMSDQESYQASQQDEITRMMAEAQQAQEDVGSMDGAIESAREDAEQCASATKLLNEEKDALFMKASERKDSLVQRQELFDELKRK